MSKSTVSRVLNRHPRVAPEIVEVVNAAIAELGYVPNRAARSLVGGKTQQLAIVIPERTADFFSDPYFGEVIQGAALHASATNYTLTLLIESAADPAKTTAFLAGGNVDGALVLSHHSRMQDYAALSPALPVVFGVRPLVPTHPTITVVDVDNVRAAELATTRLIEAGCTRIGIIAGPLETSAGIDRLTGWTVALERAGLARDRVAIGGQFTAASGALAMEQLLARDPDIDAVFAASAQLAAGAQAVLHRVGVSMPERISMSTVDENVFARDAAPALTTVDLRTAEKGAQLVSTLIDLIAGADVPERVIIECDLIERDSVRRTTPGAP